MAHQIEGLQKLIKSDGKIKWSEDKILSKFIKEFTSRVNEMEETAQYLLEKTNVISNSLKALETCELSPRVFLAHLSDIQKVLDEFNFKGFANLDLWVKDLEESLETVLKKRLVDIIQTWLAEFEGYKNRDYEKKLIRENTIHEIIVSNQTMVVSPPIEYAKAFWMSHFHACLGIVCS